MLNTTNKLVKKYSEFFQSPNFNIECAKGWNDILENMFKEFIKENIKLRISQIKEKYGSLRVYIEFPGSMEDYSKTEKIIHKAEEESRKTCELCGKKATVKNVKGWYSCICVRCRMIEKLKGN